MAIKITKWTMYDLGDIYNISTEEFTYLRLIFVCSKFDEESKDTIQKSAIECKELNPYENFFTADISCFPKGDVSKLMDCCFESMEALLNSQDNNPVLKEFLSFFIKNIDTDGAVFVPVALNRDVMRKELALSNGKQIIELWEILKKESFTAKNINPIYHNLKEGYRKLINDHEEKTKILYSRTI